MSCSKCPTAMSARMKPSLKPDVYTDVCACLCQHGEHVFVRAHVTRVHARTHAHTHTHTQGYYGALKGALPKYEEWAKSATGFYGQK